MNLSHDTIGRTGNDGTGEELFALRIRPPVPDAGKRKDGPACECKIVRPLRAVFELSPLIESDGRNKTALFLERKAVGGGCCDGFRAGIDVGELDVYLLAPMGDESPFHEDRSVG